MAKMKRVDIDHLRVQIAAKSLLANIRFASIDAPVRSLAITSSIPDEGKTTVAVALAKAIASQGERVLLVETDMRRRSLSAALGAHSRGGLYSVVCGEMDLDDAVATTSTRGLHFLDVEPHLPNPEAVLNSKRFVSFHDSAVSSYRYVIFDTPPLSAFVDAAVLSTVVDGTLLVVGENLVHRDELINSYAQLQKAGANVLGAVTNYGSGNDSTYYARYYEEPAGGAPKDMIAEEPLAQRDDVRFAAKAPAPAPQMGGAAQRANAVQPVKPAAPIHQAGRATVSPDSTAQFMVGRYSVDTNQQGNRS